MATKKRSSRKSSGRKYGKAAGKRVESAMRRRKRGTLRSGKGGRGGKVKSRAQAIAIGLSGGPEEGSEGARQEGRTAEEGLAEAVLRRFLPPVRC